jgi:hypothetical protein
MPISLLFVLLKVGKTAGKARVRVMVRVRVRVGVRVGDGGEGWGGLG